MSLASRLLSASGGTEQLYSDDVFSAYTYTGNGSTQTINNGIDLAGKGGLVWNKARSAVGSNQLIDTARGVGKILFTDRTESEFTSSNSLSAFNSNGFTLSGTINQSSVNYVSWTFRRSPKFFDVVTYTGNGVAGRQIAHELGVAPGMVIVKNTNTAGYNWPVFHRSTGGTQVGYLNLTNSFTASDFWNNTAPTDTVFTVGTNQNVNFAGMTYVAYLFAHDPSADGIVQCGSFTTDASGNATVNLGWEPQYLMVKHASGTPSAIQQNWLIYDQMRGMPTQSGNAERLYANLSSAAATGNDLGPTATGFESKGNLSANVTFVYLAIRRPNKPPTTGTQVFNTKLRAGDAGITPFTGIGFAPDVIWAKSRNSSGSRPMFHDRLRGVNNGLYTDLNNGDSDVNAYTSFNMDGFTISSGTTMNSSGINYVHSCFKRAPGVFSQICYTGTSSNKTEVHDLNKAPSLIIVKSRSLANDWNVWCDGLLGTEKLVLNSTAAKVTDITAWNSSLPSSSTISLGTASSTNASAATYVAYLFASSPGISKVDSYTGNGTSQTIDCGFTTGSRFVLIKRTDAAGDWCVWDTARGIVAGNDPHLSMNTLAAEVTTNDSIDPATSGFIVNQVAATNINVNAAQYIFLAMA